MSEMTIRVMHTGKVCVSPYLPFGGESCSPLKASGLFGSKKDRIWLPISSYLIECDHGKILFDCGWNRSMAPEGKFDKKAQIKSLGSRTLYQFGPGKLAKGQAVNEQLAALGIKPEDLDLVLLSHLDDDHANGLKLVKDAKKIMVSDAEMKFTTKGFLEKKRYNPAWWEGTKITTFDWNGTEGPAGKSYDIYGDGSLVMVNIPGHSDGQCALKIKNKEGKYVLLFADGGYAEKSWKEMIVSGIAVDRDAQRKSLLWIHDQSISPDCVESLANHDTDVVPHVISL